MDCIQKGLEKTTCYTILYLNQCLEIEFYVFSTENVIIDHIDAFAELFIDDTVKLIVFEFLES